jgi:CYTH domain-containing protein
MPVGTEIERKYLLREVPPGIEWTEILPLRQGYVALDGETEVRLRLDESSATLTVKHGGGRVRVEEEMPLDRDRAEALWELTRGRRIQKTRRRARLDDLLLEVDQYEGELEGLLVAEVEFPDRGAADRFEPPGWFGREVTEDSAYKNRSLACNGRPEEEA